jgi:hypothetical protein
MYSQWPEVIRSLLAFKPFARFYLVSAKKEWFVQKPEWLWIPEESEFAFYGCKGDTDIINLSLVEHLRIDDDFGMMEAKKLMES